MKTFGKKKRRDCLLGVETGYQQSQCGEPSTTLEPLTASLPTPDSLNPHGGPGGQGLNNAGPGPGTPLYPGPSPGPGPGPNPGFATPTHGGGGGGHTPLPGQGSHFVHGPPSYNSSPVPPGPSTPGQGGGNSNHFPSPGPGYNPQGGPGGPGPHFNGPSGAPPPFSSPYPSPGSVGPGQSGNSGPHPPQGHPGFPGGSHPQFGPGPNGGPGGHPGFGGHPGHGPGMPGVMASPMGGPGGMGGHPPNMGGVGPPMGGPGSGPGGPNPGMGPMGGPGSMGGMGGPGPIGGPMGGPPGPMGGPGERIDQHPGGPPFFNRRHPGPYFNQPDYRIYELNKRLQQRTEVVAMESDNLWWDAFATEFFEDDATLTLTFCLEDGPKRYTIGRTLIPRYFRTIFEGGVTELNYQLRHAKESFHQTTITLDCDQCTMITQHGKPMYTKVCTEGRLILEFTFDDLMRIKSWHFAVRTHRELVPRSVLASQDPSLLDQMSKNVTRQGITPATLNYLRLCVILEPMQELMSRHKAYALSPRDCLKTTLFQKWQRMVAPPETQRPPNKRRKRKGSQTGGGAGINQAQPAAPNKKRSPGPNFSLASQDVMVVGEPSLMGGEFGDEDERLITRLENTQYDPAVSLDDPSGGGGGGPPSAPPSQFNSGPPAELGCRTSGTERSQSVGRGSKAGRRK